ncbi:hypothetical protein GWR56_06150 [Mucilaginibacter sp. 14171R-50]|uniref:hypothetical protein n=1 Tax=Mucilaginibacter sp. 14171R-50 TaxID=2703789 RepID=UPI00138BC51A|nr:hypothetical protein [Mucilaginibacter sp. 14171R-50]QHS55138.1 hypothetical protein GWR56_06150 [Mucilaginibacter sp. 14171R-50]
MKLISPKLHGIIDYLLILFLFASPTLFAMPNNVSTDTYLLAAVQLILTIVTDYSFGMFRMVPLGVHRIIELIISLGLIVSAFTLFQYDERSKPYYLGLGVIWFIAALFTDTDKKRDAVKAPIL